MVLSYLKNCHYDFTQEGKDPIGKTVVAVKGGVVAATVFGGRDLILRQPAHSIADAMARGGRYLFWCTALTTTYTSTILIATTLRNKDDPLNYALAAITTAGVLYSITKDGKLSYTLGLLGIIGGTLFKSAVNMGYKPFDFSDLKPNMYREYYNFDNTPDLRYSQ